jgi:diaminopropionate ammonia-lyase
VRIGPDAWARDRSGGPAPPAFFTAPELKAVRTFYAGAAPTPLRRLPGLARDLGLGEVTVKDESDRFGMPAFKVAGVRFAADRLLDARGGAVTTLAAATTGNHGRAVARVARERGLAARIYVPRDAEPHRVEALRQEGADVVVTDVGYDETVRVMARDAAAGGWTVVSDASWDGYEEIPRWIMAGYTTILDESRTQWAARPDIVVVQAGIGSLAGAAAGWLAATFGEGVEGVEAGRPRLVIAEPAGAACVQASLRAGRRVALDACAPTAMAGLRCAEVSPLAWPTIYAVADAAIAVTEEQNDAAMARLREGRDGDPPVAAGPSGACGVAALTRLMTEDALAPMRDALGVTRASRVLAVVTEGRGQVLLSDPAG